MICTVKSFIAVNETEVDVFLEFPCFLYDPVYVGNLISGFYTQLGYLEVLIGSLACKILSITLLAWEMRATIQWFKLSLVLPLLGIKMRIDLFLSCGHCWVLQICKYIECSTVIASSFRILNSSAETPLPPLALLTAVLWKARLTSHSRMSVSG